MTISAAFYVASGKVLTKCKKRHRHEDYLDFLKHVDANVPQDFGIHLVIDNYSTQKHAPVKPWLALHLRFYVSI